MKSSSKLTFTPEQHKAILEVLQQYAMNHNLNHIVNQPTDKSYMISTIVK